MSGFARRYPSPRLVAVGSAAALALSFLVLASANAQSERVEREIAGSGADDMAAILSALQEATFQICGVRISSTLDVKSTQIETDDGVRMIDWINRSIRASTAKPECEIESYDVLEISGDGSQRTRDAQGLLLGLQGAGPAHGAAAHRSTRLPDGGGPPLRCRRRSGTEN